MTEAAEIAAKLTEAQRRALTHAAFLLDAMAGEGVGVEVTRCHVRSSPNDPA